MIELPRKVLLALTRIAAPDSMNRYTLEALNVIEGQGGWRLEASDAKRLAVLRGPLQELPEEHWPPALLHARLVREVISSAKGETARIVPGAISLLVECGDAAREITKGDGRFPDVSTVIPLTPPVAEAKLNPELLISLLQLARELFGKEPGEVTVKLHQLGTQGCPVSLSCHHGGLYLDMILMPLT